MWIATGRGKSSGPVVIHSSGQTIFSLAHREEITLGAGEAVDDVAGGAGGMGLDGICKVGEIYSANAI